jgi:DNA-binding protein H-NS
MQLILQREQALGMELTKMARPKNLSNMSFAELEKMQADIERMKAEKHNSERVELREKLTALAKQHGFDIHELFGKAGKGRGKVAVKYRDPSNPSNTWTGRGRMPRWMVAATKGGKAEKDDFLIA